MYKLIGENNLDNPREQILKNRGITEDLLNVGEEAVEDYMNYDNIIEGCELLMKHIEEGNKICLVIDEDSDGFLSSSILYMYFRDVVGYDIIPVFHKRAKAHGLSGDLDFPNDVKLIVLPDAGTNDQKQIKELNEHDIDVLILDHHTPSVELKNGIIVNNQVSKNVNNKDLCGAGVVYKFLQAFSDYYYFTEPSMYIDLNAIANIGDMMLLTSHETRYYVKTGLKKINNKFIKALMDEKSFEMDGKNNIHTHSFNTIPLINAVVRAGSMEDKRLLFQGICSNDIDFCKEVAKKCKNIKSKQDQSVKKNVEKICKYINVKNEDKVIIANSMGANKSQTGLIASKIVSKYKLPTILYSEQNGVCFGSGRGLECISLREDIESSKLLNFAQGHSNAFGISFDIENLDKIREYMNIKYKDIDFGNANVYEVDFILDEFELNQDFVNIISEFENEVSKGFSEPLIVIKDSYVNLYDDNIKGKLNVVWDIYGVKVIKKFTSNIWKGEWINTGAKYCDIVCKCFVDSYTGNGSLEVVDIKEV